MKGSYLLLSAFVFLLSLFFAVPGHWDSRRTKTRHPLLRPNDGESILARGEKLELSTASIYDLELITGISDKLAQAVLSKREEIRLRAAKLQMKQKKSALIPVHGIGEKRALLLDR